MPIQSLSDSDIRALGSSLVLNDARSVIKELIDNALDAHADTISIEISANTVDVIQVKDNGSGIGVEDRNLLCKRGCTSKIRTIQDLENLGGSSLGFRGEALASVAGLSNCVVVTTRIDGEPVGSASKFSTNGNLLSSTSASHPVGTTIRVEDFLKTIPVRRQTAIKAASKILSEIKKILQAYSFARPTVRISFKVLRAKNEKYNWTYGPKPGSISLLDATAKIVGQEVAAQCEAKSWTSNVEGKAQNALVIDAVVAKGEGDPVKIGNKGRFISIDGRPISTTRGVFRDFTKTYKAYYRQWLSGRQKDCVADPFLCLHLRCPKGSYDVNIEPAKDEVLFTDASLVQKLLEDFLKGVYGELLEDSREKDSHDSRGIASIPQSQYFELFLAKKDRHVDDRPKNASKRDQNPEAIKRSGLHEQEEESDSERRGETAIETSELAHGDHNLSASKDNLSAPKKLHRNMYDFDHDDFGAVDPSLPLNGDGDDGTDHAELRDASTTNPWTIAKINAPILSSTDRSSNVGPENINKQLMTPSSDPGQTHMIPRPHRNSFDPGAKRLSPVRSDSSVSSAFISQPGPSIRRRIPVPDIEEDDIEFTQESTNTGSKNGNNPFSESLKGTTARKLPSPSSNRSSVSIDRNAPLDHLNEQRYHGSGTQTEIPSTQLTDPIEDAMTSSLPPSSIRKPFKPPVKTPEKTLALSPPLNLTPPTSPRLEQSPRWQQSQWSVSEGQNTSPVSHALPPPLSQSHRHPMASPPRLQPSPPSLSKALRQSTLTPNSDLDEIMDFEHRKKAVNSQRKSQNKLTNRYLNPGQLAQIQQESTASLQAQESSFTTNPFRKLAPPSVNVPDEIDDSYNPARSVGEKNSNPQPEALQGPANRPSQKHSPHQNRYQAAKAALTRPKPPNPLSHAHPPVEDDENALDNNTNSNEEEEETPPPLVTTDPRAYLIQHRNPSRSAGLKVKRTKTSKLPFETIPTDSMTHSLSARPHDSFPLLRDLAIQSRDLGRVDGYVLTGKNDFMDWDANDALVPAWQEKIVRLVRERYVARIGNEGEEVPANLQLSLGVVLRERGMCCR